MCLSPDLSYPLTWVLWYIQENLSISSFFKLSCVEAGVTTSWLITYQGLNQRSNNFLLVPIHSECYFTGIVCINFLINTLEMLLFCKVLSLLGNRFIFSGFAFNVCYLGRDQNPRLILLLRPDSLLCILSCFPLILKLFREAVGKSHHSQPVWPKLCSF